MVSVCLRCSFCRYLLGYVFPSLSPCVLLVFVFMHLLSYVCLVVCACPFVCVFVYLFMYVVSYMWLFVLHVCLFSCQSVFECISFISLFI